MFEITLKEILNLRDEIILRSTDKSVIAKCEELTADYVAGVRKLENTKEAQKALYKLFNLMPRIKFKTAAIRQLKESCPEIDCNKEVATKQTVNCVMTQQFDFHPKATKVVVKIFAKRFINGPRSVKKYNIVSKKEPHYCIVEYKRTESILIVQYDRHGKVVSNIAQRPAGIRFVLNVKNNGNDER